MGSSIRKGDMCYVFWACYVVCGINGDVYGVENECGDDVWTRGERVEEKRWEVGNVTKEDQMTKI